MRLEHWISSLLSRTLRAVTDRFRSHGERALFLGITLSTGEMAQPLKDWLATQTFRNHTVLVMERCSFCKVFTMQV